MNLELMYPLVYAPMEIKTDAISDGISVFLPNLAYLVSEETVYKADGKKDIKYKVVFLKDGKNLEQDIVNIPTFNLFNNECTNAHIVDYAVFDKKLAIEHCIGLNTRQKSKIALYSYKSLDELNKKRSVFDTVVSELFIALDEVVEKLEKPNLKK